MSHIEYKSFFEIPLGSSFFDSLRSDYSKFDDWYASKAEQNSMAYVLYNDNEEIVAFLYLKPEEEEDKDIFPVMPYGRRLKVGTLKVDAHGSRLGDRIIKKIMDNATELSLNEIYVTIFEKHKNLIQLLKRYGFRLWGEKNGDDGKELVYVKSIGELTGNLYFDYPVIDARVKNYWSLSIYPSYHTKMFPDSILKNESYDLLSDIAPTNTITKYYISKMGCILQMNPGDVVMIYRTSDQKGPARYRSVVTSVCVVDEISDINDYPSVDDFVAYCRKGSIFTQQELEGFYSTKQYPYIIKMTYNISLNKKVTNEQLQDEVGLRPAYWGCFKVSQNQLEKILRLGQANLNLIKF